MRIKEIMLGLIIAVVFLMFAVYGTKLIYSKPVYSDYCNKTSGAIPLPEGKQNISIPRPEQIREACRPEYDAARKSYSQNLFMLSLIASVIVIISSIVLIKVDSVSGGLMFGSLMFIIYGTGSYWQYMDDAVRFLILGLSLGILIYAGYRMSDKSFFRPGKA